MLRLLLIIILLLGYQLVIAQEAPPQGPFWDRFLTIIEKKCSRLQSSLVAKQEKVLLKLRNREEKLYKKMLEGKDSLVAKVKLEEMKVEYGKWSSVVEKGSRITNGGQYIPFLDSINTALKFLNQVPAGEKLKETLAKTEKLKNEFQQAEEIKKFIQERKKQLEEGLASLGKLKEIKQLRKEVYYYTAQLKEYKAILSDPNKIEKKALELLSQSKWFKEFFKQNSMLTSIFRTPVEGGNLAGLQTRMQVNGLVLQQFSGAGANPGQLFQQQMQGARDQIQQLRNRIPGGGGSSDDIMPEGFRPNEQKTKTFLKRMELGTNLQLQKARAFFPNTSDLGLSLGYKLDDSKILGVGGSYKLGFGTGWRNVAFSSQGMSLRSFLDWKMKGSFWISGGFEMNYTPGLEGKVWQQSGLLGVSKKYQVTKKIKGKMQLLWDFLSYQQVPRAQSIVFRIGYNLQ